MIGKKGFTLIEITVALLVTTIVIGMSATMLLSFYNIIPQNSAMKNDKVIAEEVLRFISEEIKFAAKVEILPSGSQELAKYHNVIFFEDGKAYYNKINKDNPEDTINAELYNYYSFNNRTIRSSTGVTGAHNLNIKIELLDKEGNTVYQAKSTIRVNTLKTQGGEIEGNVLEELVNPVISFDVS